MRSYVVKRFSHFRHSRRRRMDSASLLSRESTTLSSMNPQKGHFICAVPPYCSAVSLRKLYQQKNGGTEEIRQWLSGSLRKLWRVRRVRDGRGPSPGAQ